MRCRAALLRACASVAEAHAGRAREHALWLWGDGDGGGGEGLGGGGAAGTIEAQMSHDDGCVLATMQVLARAGDLEGARRVFEAQPPPHSAAAWAEMLRLEREFHRTGLVLEELGVPSEAVSPFQVGSGPYGDILQGAQAALRGVGAGATSGEEEEQQDEAARDAEGEKST